MKKTAKIIAWWIGGAAVLALAVFGSGYCWSLRSKEAPVLPSMAVLTPQGDIALHQSVDVTLDFELPLWRRPEKAVIEAAPGSVAVGSPKIEGGLWKWSRRVWHVAGRLRPARPGEVMPGVLAVEFTPAEKGGEPAADTAEIPGFTVLPLKLAQDAHPELADAVGIPGGRRFGALWLLLLIPAALLLWYRFGRRTATDRELPPWEKALAALRHLGDDIAGRRISLETGFIRLTDLVRNYLEARFALPASTRTTVEFLEELNDPAGPLPPEQRPFLREFLEAADLVKFAKAPADDLLLRNAMARAAELIDSTRAGEDGENGEVRHV